MHILTPTYTSETLSLRALVAGRADYYGSLFAERLPHRRCDAITFDNLSAGCHSPMRKGEYWLPDNPSDWANSVTSLLHKPACNKHPSTNGEVAFA